MMWCGGGQLLPGEVVCYFQSIVSTSCGSGVIGAGCCRLDGVKRRERKSAGEAGKWPDSLDNSDRSAARLPCRYRNASRVSPCKAWTLQN